jgi:hypothetical protein
MPQESGSLYPLSHELRAAAGKARERGDLITYARLAGAANKAYEQECDEIRTRLHGGHER